MRKCETVAGETRMLHGTGDRLGEGKLGQSSAPCEHGSMPMQSLAVASGPSLLSFGVMVFKMQPIDSQPRLFWED